MSSELTIQQVAEKTGLSPHTLRYYERVGLIPAIGRAPSGHRRYSRDDLDRIEFVARLRSTGMSIADVQRYMNSPLDGSEGVSERLGIMEAHRDRLKARIAELERFLTRIEGKVARYRERLTR